MFDPDLTLTDMERAHLYATYSSEGFKIFQQILESEVAKFRVALDNADPANERAVLAAHQMSKAAAQFYTGLVRRVNEEINLYTNSRQGDKPVDVTEGVLDLQNEAPELKDIFGGEE